MNVWFGMLTVGLIATGAAWVGGNRHGTHTRDLECKAEITVIDKARAKAVQDALDAREAGRKAGDAAAARTLALESQITTTQRKLDEEIRKRASAVRRALDGQLVGMLNALSPIRETVGGTDPARPTGTEPAGADAAPPTDRARPSADAGWGASEQSVARALGQCRGGYEVCRSRLHSLQDWAKAVSE